MRGMYSTPQSPGVTPTPWIEQVAAARHEREGIGIRRHEAGERDTEVDDRVTVVVVTADRREELLSTLDRLRELPEQPHVIVLDNASRDGTFEAVRRLHPWVESFALRRNVGAAARNLGVRAATTPYVAFNDDDTWWEPGSLGAGADLLDAYPRMAVATARIVVEPTGVEDPVVGDMRTSGLPDDERLPGSPLLSILAGASLVRRAAFVQVGGFEPKLLIGGEEELFATDLASCGWALRYVPDLVVHHEPSPARDADARRALGLRNTLWFTWLRRPVRDALRRTYHTLADAPSDVVTARAVVHALSGAAWVRRERHVAPVAVTDGLRVLDPQQRRSAARNYVS